jgi:hypothetical protein
MSTNQELLLYPHISKNKTETNDEPKLLLCGSSKINQSDLLQATDSKFQSQYEVPVLIFI